MSDNAIFVLLASLFVVPVSIIVIISMIKGDPELDWRLNEKNLQELKKYLKKSKAIDQQQANRINTLLEESISILRQKKISKE